MTVLDLSSLPVYHGSVFINIYMNSYLKGKPSLVYALIKHVNLKQESTIFIFKYKYGFIVRLLLQLLVLYLYQFLISLTTVQFSPACYICLYVFIYIYCTFGRCIYALRFAVLAGSKSKSNFKHKLLNVVPCYVYLSSPADVRSLHNVYTDKAHLHVSDIYSWVEMHAVWNRTSLYTFRVQLQRLKYNQW